MLDYLPVSANNLAMPPTENNVVLRCAFCGADVADLRAEHCATCSRPILATLKRLGVDFDSLTIYSDLPCTQCDYNLRTIHIESKCPECGTPVMQSVIEGSYQLGNEAWRRRVRFGVRCMLVSILLPLATVAAIIFLEYGRASLSKSLRDVLFVCSVDFPSILLAIGLWFVTLPKPERTPGLFRLWRIVPIVSSILLILLAATLTIQILVPSTPIQYTGLPLLCLAFVPLGIITALTTLFRMATFAGDLVLAFLVVTSGIVLAIISVSAVMIFVGRDCIVLAMYSIVIEAILLLLTLGTSSQKLIPSDSIHLRHRHRRDDGE